jgi:phosphoglycerol transferase MdoB-like AlkP superfamily enzyme
VEQFEAAKTEVATEDDATEGVQAKLQGWILPTRAELDHTTALVETELDNDTVPTSAQAEPEDLTSPIQHESADERASAEIASDDVAAQEESAEAGEPKESPEADESANSDETDGLDKPHTAITFVDKHPKLSAWWPLIAFPLVIIYFEWLLKWRSGVDAPGRFHYPALFSVGFGLVVALLTSSTRSPRRNRIIAVVSLSLIALWFITELLVHQSFSVYMSPFFMSGNAGGVVGSYAARMVDIVISGVPSMLAYAVPIVGVWFVAAKVMPLQQVRLRQCGASLAVAVVAQLSALVILATTTGGIIPDNAYYRSNYDINQAVQRFGLLTATRLDAQYTVTGVPQPDVPSGRLVPMPHPEPDPIDRSPNVLPVNFAGLAATESDSELAALDRYYAGVVPTVKNEYTGMFEGKNLIVICAEAFSDLIVTPELFPTIYKLTHNGFYFTQYYQPAWGGSTSTGEWSELTGLFPNGAGAMSDSRYHDMTFTIAPALTARGYLSRGFHNNNYAYYDRDVTHTNLGYDWMGIGNGMASLPNPVTGGTGVTEIWPESDLEMMQVTTPLYLEQSDPFNVYYMTVSGHALYGWDGNNMSWKNRERTDGLPYSEQIKGYIAANLELEDAMTYLVAELTRAGVLDDTVIVMTNDHYPYGLEPNEVNSRDYWAEYLGVGPESTEYYRSSWILYNSAMEETVEVTKPTYSLDILPTLLNLFGVDYDSRLFTGKDALAPGPGLAIFPDLSWISSEGAYDSKSDKYTPNATSGSGDAYARTISNMVRSATANAKAFQRLDYWARVKPK